MIEILWPDGSVMYGETWPELESNMRKSQFFRYKTKWEFRRAMRRRAFLWSGTRPALSRSSHDFIRSLADCGMFMITEGNPNA